ncbi:MAG: TonB family protein [Rhodocyclaceae bacterium]|nr:TonB family protein [Rhodocyclaceae bacterium]
MTTNSLSRQPEKAHETGGIPLRWLVLSLALHALALGALTPLIADGSAGIAPTETLHAMLRPVPEAASTTAVPAPLAAATPPQAGPPPLLAASAPTFTKPSRQQAASAQIEQSAPAVLPAPTFSEKPAPAAPGGELVQQATAKPATVALAAPAAAHGPDAAGLRQYRLALAGEARRFRRYPDAARREGITGTAEVRVTVAAAGAARHAELAHSSGHAVLDAAALDMLRQATARALLPESLRGQDFAVLLPVVFEVEQ